MKLLVLLVGFLCFLVGGWGLYCLQQNQAGRQEWARVNAELEAKGENLDWVSFVPEPVLDELNFAKTPVIESIQYRMQVVLKQSLWIKSGDAGAASTHLADPDARRRADY